MRIGISGPGGTGKTTLVCGLSARLGFPKVEEGVREWLRDEGAAGPWSLTAAQQLRMQHYAVGYKIEREIGPAFVSDRTTVDALSLATLRLQRLGLEVPRGLREQALCHARNTYDVAILMGPHRVTSIVDEVALIDETLRAREHACTLSLYEALGTPLIHVPELPAASIEPFVLEKLQQRLGNGRT